MKKILAILVAVLMVIPAALAVTTGTGIGITITTEKFSPLVWLCDNRLVSDDAVEPGRNGAASLGERINNYAFEGEQIYWKVLVMDKNKIEQVAEVVGTIDSAEGPGNDIEVQCNEVAGPVTIPDSCNARILEQKLSGTAFDPNIMGWYECTFTVETPISMAGEYFYSVEAISSDPDEDIGIADEDEYWFLNPELALSIDGDMAFDEVRPGTMSYSSTILVGNDAEDGSGVLMDMFISGTDFYDPDPSGAMCPNSNRLKLGDETLGPGIGMTPGICGAEAGLTADIADHLCYYATNGAYSTADAAEVRKDVEGYVPISYGDTFTIDFYNDAEIIYNTGLTLGGAKYSNGNVLAPGSEIALTFKLALPEPCVGDFSEGDIYFWGEAI